LKKKKVEKKKISFLFTSLGNDFANSLKLDKSGPISNPGTFIKIDKMA